MIPCRPGAWSGRRLTRGASVDDAHYGSRLGSEAALGLQGVTHETLWRAKFATTSAAEGGSGLAAILDEATARRGEVMGNVI